MTIGSLILSDAVLQGLGRRQDLLGAFPFLRLAAIRGTQGGCRCNRSAAVRGSLQSETERIKKAIMALPPDRLAVLKGLLNASELVFYISSPQGVVKKTL